METGLATGALPRIWWLGTGFASSMPFHAAGTHTAGSTENAFDRVISSYTPSIKALGHARQRARATANAHGSLLIATMPTTPGSGDPRDPQKPSDLPGVMEETNLITGAGRHLPTQRLDSPSVEQVVGSLKSCCIAHFSCHGYTDHRDPSNSGLILQSCEAGLAAQDRLTVRRVSELSLAGARLAYLSACSTAENKAARLADEVIHVVSGFQVAGFPHVVGCLWPSIDRVCVEVASRFYSSLLGPGNSGWDDRAVASSLREAVMAVRATEMGMPLAWAQFVHYGA
ncbi:CHAT domain-containing protein [Coniochaeta sp. 2T2.1]|nr:CHAT domain-containing protein [Coniochaeta sp. 2T2.1]